MPPTETLRPGERGGAGGSATGGPEQTYIIRQSNKYYEHRDSQATAMSVDYSGQWVLLAGRGHLALQRLGQDDGSLRRHERQSKYEVSVAEFAICPSRKEYCAIAVSNQECLSVDQVNPSLKFQTSQYIDIVRWGTSEPHYEMSLRGHTRTVTDIDWHGKDPNLLVSCSIDTFSHIWDLREPRKPALSLNAVCMCKYYQRYFYDSILNSILHQLVPPKWALIESRETFWLPLTMGIYASGTFARVAAPHTTSQHI